MPLHTVIRCYKPLRAQAAIDQAIAHGNNMGRRRNSSMPVRVANTPNGRSSCRLTTEPSSPSPGAATEQPMWRQSDEPAGCPPIESLESFSAAEKLLVLKMIIKVSDIGNVTKGREYCLKWTDAVSLSAGCNHGAALAAVDRTWQRRCVTC